MKFYLGTNKDAWLKYTAEPLFISNRTLAKRKTLPQALGPWALDSGGFTELSTHGTWTVSAKKYVAFIRRYVNEVGKMEWAAPQDWMCEPWIINKTGLSVAEHQRRTVANYLELRNTDPSLPVIPVLQGWALDDYDKHVDMYAAAGVHLSTLPVVGLGSVCRRQATNEIANIVGRLHARGIRLHGFGVKTSGIGSYGALLTSADSMAWSFTARKQQLRLPQCEHKAKTCGDCLVWALLWRDRVVARVREPQPTLFDLFNSEEQVA